MKTILIVGAGRQGKGFLGEVFEAAKWRVQFLDKDIRVIEELKKKPYHVKLYQSDCTAEREVRNYEAFTYADTEQYINAIVNADIIALSLYPEDIEEAVKFIALGLKERAKCKNVKKITFLSCTNINHFIPVVEKYFEDALEDEWYWFKENAVVRDVIVRRSTDAETNYSMELKSLAVMSLLIQGPICVDVSEVPWMELKDNIEELKDIKLYTYNAPHATCAYAGYAKGYHMINESAADPEIAKLMSDVLKEAIPALSKEFKISEEEIRDFCTTVSAKEEMDDSIFRVAKDPIRKLSRNDRLTGNAMFCYKYGLHPDALLRAIAYGMAYADPADDKAMEIQNLIRTKGIKQAISLVTGVPEDHELVKKVSKIYNNIR